MEGPGLAESLVTDVWVHFIALVQMGFPAHMGAVLLGKELLQLGVCSRDGQSHAGLTVGILKQMCGVRSVECTRNTVGIGSNLNSAYS